VLSGAVLTSFIGVTGLIRRMALDQCLPQFLLKQTRRGTSHRIVIAFFLLCSSILLLTGGNLLSLAGVYTISFLGVMTLFGLGNILLKVRRRELKRTYRAGWVTILLAMVATSLGILGNVIIDYHNLSYFSYYFIPTVFVVVLVYMRIPILRASLEALNDLMTRFLVWRSIIVDQIVAMSEQRVVLFTRGGRIDRLHDAFSYIVKNEPGRSVVVCHLYNSPDQNEEASVKQSIGVIQEIFPELKVELSVRQGRFGPEVIDAVSREFGVQKNNIFIGAPEEKHDFSIQDLGGVRVIF
jgi:hypothetical protein